MVRQIRGTVNYIELIGWVGDAPEQRLLPSGTTVCSFSVATKRFAGRDESGERIYDTDWANVEGWDRLAATCLRYLHKGSRVRVVGSLHAQSWDDKETGQRRYKTVVRAEEVMFLDSRGGPNGAVGEAVGEAESPLSAAETEAEEGEEIPY